MRGRWLILALIATPALAGAQTIDPGGSKVDQGTNNVQSVDRPAGDRSVVRQTAGPGSNGNAQSVTISSKGDAPNLATQQTQGADNTQSIVMPGGSGNVVVQKAGPGSAGSMQSAVITGTGITVKQDSDSGGGTQVVHSSGQGSTVVQTQRGQRNHQSVVQTGTGNVAIQTQRGNGLRGTMQQHGGQTDVQVQEPGRTE
jgi:hypothetical protein